MCRTLILVNALWTACCSSGPCPSGQQLRVEKYPASEKIKGKGCAVRDADGHYWLQGKWQWFYESGQRKAEGAYRDGGAGCERGMPKDDRPGLLDCIEEIPTDGAELEWVFWHENGKELLRLVLKDGKPDGVATRWYPNGQKLMETRYADGRLDGISTAWTQSGERLSETRFRRGFRYDELVSPPPVWQCPVGQRLAEEDAPSGILERRGCVMLDASGSRKKEGRWETYYENGRKESEVTYRDEIPVGLALHWYPDGQKASEGSFKDGKAEGPWIRWHENGQKQEESVFSAGKQEGVVARWDSKGQKVFEAVFKGGSIVEGSVKRWGSDGQPSR